MATTVARDEVLYLRSAGVDVGKRFVLACVRAPDPKRPGRWVVETERFDTTAEAVRGLRDWLAERAVEVVALEATSDYVRHEGV
jgi:transposase